MLQTPPRPRRRTSGSGHLMKRPRAVMEGTTRSRSVSSGLRRARQCGSSP